MPESHGVLDALEYKEYTLGIELELPYVWRPTDLQGMAQWSREEGAIRDDKGIGNDPHGVYNNYGGELIVEPTSLGDHDPESVLLERVRKLLNLTNCPPVDRPTTIHMHIRLDKLFQDRYLQVLKNIVDYTQRWGPDLFPILSPLPSMEYMDDPDNFESERQQKMFKKEYKAKYMYQHSILKDWQIDRIMRATSFKEFINNMAPQNKDGRVFWNLYTRTAVNFAKMRPTDGETIEFRMFNCTSDLSVINEMIRFPRRFLKTALLNQDPLEKFGDVDWPGYYNWLSEPNHVSENWIHTDHDKVNRKEILKYLERSLIEGEITLADLGYPEYWNYLQT